MSSKKQVGKNAVKKEIVKNIIEEDNDNSDDDISNNSETDDSDDDSDSDDESEVSDDELIINKKDDKPIKKDNDKELELEVKAPKTKPKKLSINEILEDLVGITDNINKIDDEISKLMKQQYSLRKEQDKKIKLLQKSEIDNNNKENKEKKERKKSTSGINDPTKPVPEILKKFLKLDKDATLERTKVGSLLNDKFKELGLKEGKVVRLDKKTAKYFGLEEGHEIPFSGPNGFQSFLKYLYDKEKTDANL
jgi:hypothetical protein